MLNITIWNFSFLCLLWSNREAVVAAPHPSVKRTQPASLKRSPNGAISSKHELPKSRKTRDGRQLDYEAPRFVFGQSKAEPKPSLREQSQQQQQAQAQLLQQEQTGSSPVLDLEPIILDRHTKPFPRKKAVANYYTTTSTQLMLSPCRPDPNGYFGSTNSAPTTWSSSDQETQERNGPRDAEDSTTFEYTFAVTTESHLNDDERKKILQVVDDMVMDTVLAHVFPTVCSFQVEHAEEKDNKINHHNPTQQSFLFDKKNQEYRVTGFHFGNEDREGNNPNQPQQAYLEEDDGGRKVHGSLPKQCEDYDEDLAAFGVQYSANNLDNADCHVYSSTIKVYGYGTFNGVHTISKIIFTAIENSATRTANMGVIDVKSLGAVIRISDEPGFEDGDDGNVWSSTQIQIGFAIVLVFLILAIVGILMYMQMYVKNLRNSSAGKSLGDNSTANTSIRSYFFSHAGTGTHVGDEESSKMIHRQTGRIHQKNSRRNSKPQEKRRKMMPIPCGSDLSSIDQLNRTKVTQPRVIIEFANSYERSEDEDSVGNSSALPADYYNRTYLDYETPPLQANTKYHSNSRADNERSTSTRTSERHGERC